MNTRSKAVAPNTTADVPNNVNAPHTSADPTRDDTLPPWARVLIENVQANSVSMQAISVSLQSLHNKFDQHEIRLQKLESPKKSNSWEASSSQVKIPEEPINDHLDSSNVVPSNDHYLRDRTDYQYNQVRVDISMFKGSDGPKEFLNWESHLDSYFGWFDYSEERKLKFAGDYEIII